MSEFVYYCERHDEYVKDKPHTYCEEMGFVSRWERVDRRCKACGRFTSSPYGHLTTDGDGVTEFSCQ